MTGTAFCGNCPVDPTLLSLVHNEVLQLSSSLEDFVCQFKEQNDVLKSQVLEVKQNLEELMELPQKFKQMEHEMETLKQKMADFSCSAMKRQQIVNPPSFFGALERNEYFTGRKKELESMDNVFQDVNTTWDGLGGCKKKTKVYGICGLGGCGKSSLAFEYAWRNLERYPGGVFVVNGESDDLLRASLRGICEQFVYKTQPKKREEKKQFDQLMTETLSWLGSLMEKWLLLVDNMDQKELSSCTRKLFFGQWKNKTSGDILVTSRRSSQALREDLDLRPENSLELDVFSLDESAEFLKKRSGLPSCGEDQEAGIKELAKELGGLPLALEQAAAYISVLKCCVKSYLEQYHEQKSILLNRKSAKPCSEIYNEARLAVQTTWHVNFSYIENDEKDEKLGKAAAFFMKIATYLLPDVIPIELLNVGAPEIDHDYLKNRLKMPIGAQQIIDLLHRFSLFKRNSDGTLSVHRLVQATLKERYYDEGEIQEVFSSAIRMLHQAFLDCVGGTDFLHDLHVRLDSLKDDPRTPKDAIQQCCESLDTAKLEGRRWKKLSLNAYHLLHLLKTLSFKPDYLFCEETTRLFCEAAFFCYSLGIESGGYHLQQSVLDILCTVKEPIRFYNGNELMKVTRILSPMMDSVFVLTKLIDSSMETLQSDLGGVGTNHTNELLRGIELIEPKTEEAFARGDFQTSCDLYTQIIKLSVEVNQPNVRPLGKIFCNRGIANLRMENIEKAIDDFNASINADTEHYRGYYWKVYALCKLVECGRIDFTSRAQAAAAVLHFKFARSKLDDIQKLQKKFQKVSGLLDGINYKFVTHVSHLTELESELSEKQNSTDPFTVILADGKYDFKKIVILKGCYYFVCLPGSSAILSCNEGLFLSNGSFLFENVDFENSLASESGQPFSSEAARIAAEKEKQLSITLGKSYQAKPKATTCSERELDALIEADGVESLVMDNCSLQFSTRAGVMVNAQHHQQVIVSVRSSSIEICHGPGIVIQGGTADSHISICECEITNNGYGIVIISPARFYIEKNRFDSNLLGGIVAAGGGNGGILRNALSSCSRYAILLQGSNAAIEENHVTGNFGWGIVCCIGSNLTCKKNVFENNCCGGLRIMLNGKGNVFVEKCEFRKNLGPDVFPASAKEICPLELKCKQLLQSSQEFPVIFYLCNFLDLSKAPMSKYADEFKCPVLRENRFSDVSDFLSCKPTGVCSGCWTELQSDSDWIECPSCHVARYCSNKCFDSAQAVHSFVCNSIREANHKCYPLSPLPNSAKKAASQEAGFSLCIITAVTVSLSKDPEGICLLCCPERILHTVLRSRDIYAFTMMNGSPVQESMMDIKAASILAKFDPESHTVTVYWHRIFAVDKVPNGWNWVNKALDFFANYCSQGGTP